MTSEQLRRVSEDAREFIREHPEVPVVDVPRPPMLETAETNSPLIATAQTIEVPGLVVVPNIGAENAQAIDAELVRARKWQEKFASLHEAYAVILEEVDEVWQVCLQKRPERNREEIRKELVQVAAMAIKALHSLDNFIG